MVINNIFFEISRKNDAYTITAYRVKVPIVINDKATLLENNGSVSQTDVLDSISGEKITDKTSTTNTAFSISTHKQEFEIIPNVKAFKDNSDCNVWWEQQNWKFFYTGPSYRIDESLKGLATEWSNILPAVAALGGSINMVEGNKFHALITWRQAGVQYTYSVPNNNWRDIAEVLKSFTENGGITLK